MASLGGQYGQAFANIGATIGRALTVREEKQEKQRQLEAARKFAETYKQGVISQFNKSKDPALKSLASALKNMSTKDAPSIQMVNTIINAAANVNATGAQILEKINTDKKTLSGLKKSMNILVKSPYLLGQISPDQINSVNSVEEADILYKTIGTMLNTNINIAKLRAASAKGGLTSNQLINQAKGVLTTNRDDLNNLLVSYGLATRTIDAQGRMSIDLAKPEKILDTLYNYDENSKQYIPKNTPEAKAVIPILKNTFNATQQVDNILKNSGGIIANTPATLSSLYFGDANTYLALPEFQTSAPTTTAGTTATGTKTTGAKTTGTSAQGNAQTNTGAVANALVNLINKTTGAK